MILAVDVGNTQTVLGMFSGDALVGHWRVSTDAHRTEDEIRAQVAGLLAADGRSWSEVQRIVIASVVPRLTDAWMSMARSATQQPAMVVGPGIKTGMAIRYDAPAEVGADRIVNAIAAYERFGGPVIVVDFGTATTLDVVASDGAYIGGAIAPGVETSAEALFQKAARLSMVDLEAPEKVIGSTTRQSVQAGLLLGEAVMVDGLVRRVFDELGQTAPVIATGGLAEKMAKLCETIDEVDRDLTLKGLMIVYARNV